MDTIEIVILLMAALNLMVWRWLSLMGVITPSRRVLLAFTLLNTAVILLDRIAQLAPDTLLGWFLNVNFEYNLDTIVSSVYLLSIGVVALVIAARLLTRPRIGAVWLIWGSAYLFLCYDETYMLHESLPHWESYFIGLGVLLVLVALYAVLVADRVNWRIYALLMVGLALTAAGGIVVRESYKLEEFVEVTGITVVLVAVVTYFSRLRDMDWQPVRRLLIAGNVGWVTAMVFTQFWPLPALEARFLARPSQVDYADGVLSLVGYQVDDRVYHPGDRVKVTTYWQANQPLSANYMQSVRLLQPPDDEPAQQSDLLLGPPTQPTTNVWPVNMVFRKEAYLTTQATLPSPTSYWLSVNVYPESNPLPDTRLSRLLFVSPQVIQSAPQAAEYRFDNGICLCGYELVPRQAMRFWWETDTNVDQELVQFLELRHQESGLILVSDHPPLEEQLPTVDWPAGLRVVDEWNADQMRRLSDGHYEVYTGLYERSNQNRILVRDAQGHLIPDNLIYLGTLVVESR
jgi:hypothetical protein